MTTHDLREEIDALLSAGLAIAGTPEWKDTNREGQKRWKAPLVLDGSSTGINFTIDHYPNMPFKGTHLILERGISFVRVDIGKNVSHKNRPPNMPEGIPEGILRGDHIHSWPLNRRLATSKKLPEHLAFADYLPQNLNDFSDIFPWFCDLHNIKYGFETPKLPVRDTLL